LKYKTIKVLKNITTSDLLPINGDVKSGIGGTNTEKDFNQLKDLKISGNSIFDELKRQGKTWGFW
jgi:hypothetical protein